MKKIIYGVMLLLAASVTANSQNSSNSQNMDNPNINTAVAPEEQLTLVQEWDKVFPKSDKVDHKKVTFVNRYGITLAADMYMPKGATDKLPAIVVSGPFGAVNTQI